MSAEPPPADSNGGYNPDDWTNSNDPIDNQYLAQNYLQFPLAQGSETLADTIVSGIFTAQDTSTFSDLATFNNGIDIASTAGITFSDNSIQTTAFVEANYAQLNTDNIFLPTFTNTFNGSVSLGANATATTQTSGNSTTLVATTAFVQDAVQVAGVQVSDSPLAWSGVNTWQLNAGTAGTLPYTYGYGISNLWNLTGGAGDCDIVANAGTSASVDRAYNIYCVQNNITGTALTTTTPQLSLSNNGFPMQVKDGIGIPTGKTYAINGVNILTPYSTTTQMNTAISSALTTSGFAPLASPALTGTPTISTTPTSGQTTAIANVQYVADAISGSIPSLANYAQLNTATAQTFTGAVNFSYVPTVLNNPIATLTSSGGGFQTFTTPINFSNTLMYNNLTVATTNNLPIYTSTALVFSNNYGTGSNIGTGAGTIYQQAMQQNTSTTAYVNFFSNPVYISIGNVSNMGVAPYLQLAFYTPNLSIPAKPWPNFPPASSGLGYQYVFVNTGNITQSWPVTFTYVNNISYVTFYTYSNMGNGTTAYYDFSSLGIFAS
jgi:hypothetical protein